MATSVLTPHGDADLTRSRVVIVWASERRAVAVINAVNIGRNCHAQRTCAGQQRRRFIVTEQRHARRQRNKQGSRVDSNVRERGCTSLSAAMNASSLRVGTRQWSALRTIRRFRRRRLRQRLATTNSPRNASTCNAHRAATSVGHSSATSNDESKSGARSQEPNNNSQQRILVMPKNANLTL